MENKKKDAEAMLQRLREEQRKSGKNPFPVKSVNAKVRIVDFGDGDSTYVEYCGKILYDVTKVVYTKEAGKSATLGLCIDVGMSGSEFGRDGELDDICQAIKEGKKYIPRTESGDKVTDS